MNYKVGEIVEVIGDLTGHGFEIGQKVVVRNLDNEGLVNTAHAQNDEDDYWFLDEDEIKKVEQ